MALIKTRPDVRLLLPRPLVAGQAAEFIIELDCPEPVPVDTITLSFLGEVVWFTTSQYGRHRHSMGFVDHRVPLLGEQTELEAGKHRLRTGFGLGTNLPSSWEGDRLAIEYRARVHVDIPWWPDKRADFVLRVSGARPSGVEGEEGPIVYVSRAGGPPPKGPYLELSLGQRSVRPGGTMRLGAALGNVDRNRYRQLQLSLVAEESFPTGLGGSYVQEYRVARWTVAIDEHPGELQPIPFCVELPTKLAPAFELGGCKLRWLLAVNADVAWGVDPKLRLPIHVVPPEQASPGEVAAPLAVGSDRLRLVWTRVGEQTGLELVEDRLRGLVDGVGIEVQRIQGEEGPQVIGLLEFPNLGAGLRPHRQRRGLLGGLETGLAARDEGQTRALDEQLGPLLAEGDHSLLEAEDDHLRLALDGAGLELGPLKVFVTKLVDLARAIAALELPAPAAMAEHAGAWEAAADALRGELRRADLCLSFAREELHLEIGCDFDDEGQLRSTHLELDPGQPIPSRLLLVWTGDTALPEHELPLAELAAPPTWAESARVALHIESDCVRILLPAPLPDPRLERGRIDALIAIGRQLRGRAGPYR
jgi:hypothetical protein